LLSGVRLPQPVHGVEALAIAIASAAVYGPPTAAAVAFTTAAINFGIAAAVSVGLSYAQQALARTQTDRAGTSLGDNPAGVNSPEARGNVKQATPPQRVIFGETRVGGAISVYEVDAPYLYIQQLLAALPISEFVTCYVGEQVLTLSDAVPGSTLTPLAVSGIAPFHTRLSLALQAGELDQGRNPLIVSDFSSYGTRFLTPGVPNAMYKCHYGSNYDQFVELWGNVQIPNFQWVVRGVPLPDPRNPRHILDFDPRDPEELYAAIASWDYSNTAALAQAFWTLMPFGLGAGPSRIRWDEVAEAATFDEEIVGLKVGDDGVQRFQKRHTIDGVASLHEKPNVVMEAMLTANRGFIAQRAGQVSIVSSQPRDPVLTITDAMLIGGFEFRNNKPKKDLVNIGRCRFVAPDREHQDAEGPVYRDAAAVAADGEEFDQSVRMPFTSTHQRAQRLLKGFVEEARLGKMLSCRCDMRAYGLREGDIVRRFSETGRYSQQNGLYSVEEWQLAEDRTSVSFNFAEYDPALARNWIPETNEQPFELEAA
jgi:hypothetical protein